MELFIESKEKRAVVDITSEVQGRVRKNADMVSIFTTHTTCAITTADLDPGTDRDLLDAIFEIVPKLGYRHPHDNSHEHVHAHLASSIIGPGVVLPVNKGQIVLGTWQRVVLVELDGPRKRRIIVTSL
jgi:secondary thiamine-phosphate synthase enzyme